MSRQTQSMNSVLILRWRWRSAFTAGCQATRPAYNFPCTYHADDAGFCEQPSAFVGRVTGAVNAPSLPGVASAFRLKFRRFRR